VVNDVRRNEDGQVELIIGGDFNSHDQLWGGDSVATSRRQGEGEPVVQLMADLDLQSLLPRGTETWQSGDGEFSSTIDLTLATPDLTMDTIRCGTDDTAHGSDHLAIRTEFALTVDVPTHVARLLWKRAPWDAIRKTVQQALAVRPAPAEPNDLDGYAQYMLDLVMPAI